jgi:hypothetical protein
MQHDAVSAWASPKDGTSDGRICRKSDRYLKKSDDGHDQESDQGV